MRMSTRFVECELAEVKRKDVEGEGSEEGVTSRGEGEGKRRGRCNQVRSGHAWFPRWADNIAWAHQSIDFILFLSFSLFSSRLFFSLFFSFLSASSALRHLTRRPHKDPGQQLPTGKAKCHETSLSV